MADKSMIMRSVSGTNTPSIASSTTAMAANSHRSSFTIQNLGTNTLYVRLADGATTSIFHFALKAGSVNDDGTGGSISQSESVVYTGIVSIAGVSPRYVVLETS
jgi:hypothetical protein